MAFYSLRAGLCSCRRFRVLPHWRWRSHQLVCCWAAQISQVHRRWTHTGLHGYQKETQVLTGCGLTCITEFGHLLLVVILRWYLMHHLKHLATDHSCELIVAWIWVMIGSSNGLLPDGTKPLPKPIVTYQRWNIMASTWGPFHRKCWSCLSLIIVWKSLI